MLGFGLPKLQPIREIRSRGGTLHFQRWQLLQTPLGSVFLHHILRADEDKHLHDHPWNFLTIVLKGGYVEILLRDGEESARAMTPGQGARRMTTDFHKIEKLLAPTWTLFFTGPRIHDPWGYHVTARDWVDHETYRQMKAAGAFDRG